MKNTLAIVQSLTHQAFTLPSPRRMPSVVSRAGLRLLPGHIICSLAELGNRIDQGNAATALSPFCSQERCTIEGPNILVLPQTAVSLSLALHELATNASKYGALSNDRGQVSVHWTG